MTASDLPVPPEQIHPTRDRGGQWVTIGNAQYKVPPLNFKALREHMDAINRLSGMRNGSAPSAEDFAALSGVVHAALARNYDIALADVEEMLDLGNMNDVLNAVMTTSGLVRKEPGSGEGQAAP